MKDSRETQRRQKTSWQSEGCPHEGGVEPRSHAGAPSDSPASKSGKDDGKGDARGLLERILDRDNLNQVYRRVKANGGSHGVDGMQVDELLPYLKQHGETIRQSILAGTYRPSPVRREEIPKPDGGVRLLGIPTVLDRLIQQAIAQVLTPLYDPEFSESSYGFRPGRGARQAVEASRKYIQDGYTWVVDIDLEKFFDRVNHDRLMAVLARKIGDKRVLRLIRYYLESGVMIQGVKVTTEEGTPQGGPMSPLLANILLDDLDKELEKRGHKFCRYADDCNIYVKSRRAGERVMGSVRVFIENVLKLKVNDKKSAVDRPWKRKFLGFSFYLFKDKAGIFVHHKPIERFKAKVREITSRSNGKSMEWRKVKLNRLITGWVNYFGLADMRKKAKSLDEWIRRRIRMCFWKQWKRTKTKHDNLVKLGIAEGKTWEFANTRKGYWRVSNSPILAVSLSNDFLRKYGFVSLSDRYSVVH